ncbi:hypothetical protein D910_10043 [Dendroctonus ponderosae]
MQKLIQIFWMPSRNKSVKTECLQKMLTYLRNPITQGREWSFWPDAKFYYHYKIYRPLSFYVDWPFTARERFPQYWPSNRSYRYYWDDFPSEAAFREIRLKNDLYFDR